MKKITLEDFNPFIVPGYEGADFFLTGKMRLKDCSEI